MYLTSECQLTAAFPLTEQWQFRWLQRRLCVLAACRTKRRACGYVESIVDLRRAAGFFDGQFSDDRSADGVFAAAFCGRAASGQAFGAVHRRSYRGLDLGRLSGADRGSGRLRIIPGRRWACWFTGCDGDILQPEARAGDLRLGSVSVHRGERSFRPRHDRRVSAAVLKEIEELFVEVLQLAREMGVLKMGIIGLDGTKIDANASRHSALSYEHVGRIEAQLKAEVADLLARAEAADAADVPDGTSIPTNWRGARKRLRKLAEAKAKIEARAKERHAREMAEHQAKMASREAKTAATGKKPGESRRR